VTRAVGLKTTAHQLRNPTAQLLRLRLKAKGNCATARSYAIANGAPTAQPRAPRPGSHPMPVFDTPLPWSPRRSSPSHAAATQIAGGAFATAPRSTLGEGSTSEREKRAATGTTAGRPGSLGWGDPHAGLETISGSMGANRMAATRRKNAPYEKTNQNPGAPQKPVRGDFPAYKRDAR
jgi:hypothetical protein